MIRFGPGDGAAWLKDPASSRGIHTTVPNFVPTPCIEALPIIESASDATRLKCMKTSNNEEGWAMFVPSARLLIISMLTICNQRVGGSNPSAGSIKSIVRTGHIGNRLFLRHG